MFVDHSNIVSRLKWDEVIEIDCFPQKIWFINPDSESKLIIRAEQFSKMQTKDLTRVLNDYSNRKKIKINQRSRWSLPMIFPK